MSLRPAYHPVRDFFLERAVDEATTDSSALMEQIFFSVARRKRKKPIQYETPDGALWVRVNTHPVNGMATIKDADILLWCIAQIVAQRAADPSSQLSVIKTTPSDLLEAIGRETSDQDQAELLCALKRLRTTEIETNGPQDLQRCATFHYLGDIDSQIDGATAANGSLTLRLPDWLLDGFQSDNVLALDQDYFRLTDNVARALYHAAHKHAGHRAQGWVCKIATLHEKLGSDASPKEFASRMREMCRQDILPRYAMNLTVTQDRSAAIFFIDRALVSDKVKAKLKIIGETQLEQEAKAVWRETGRNPLEFDGAWTYWLKNGGTPQSFICFCADPRVLMLQD